MSATPTTAVAQPPRPDPPQDPAGAGCAAPNRFASAVILVRKLIEYGKALAMTLTQRTADTDLVALAFGTDDIAAILARIARALHIAAALETHLDIKAAQPERAPRSDLPPAASVAALATAAEAPYAPPEEAATLAAGHPAPPDEDAAASRLARLPTAEEIAEMFRHRPIGTVIGDICLDLGILPGHELWHEMFMVMLDHGGNPHRVYVAIMQRDAAYFARSVTQSGMTMETPWYPPMPEGWSPDAPSVGGTGPP